MDITQNNKEMAIKLACMAEKDISNVWILSEKLHELNANDVLLCAGICQNVLKNTNISQNDLRKIIGAPSLMIVIWNNESNKNFKELAEENKIIKFLNATIKAQENLTNDQAKETKIFLENCLKDFLEKPLTKYSCISINNEKVEQIFLNTQNLISKLEEKIKSCEVQTKFDINDYNFVSENGHYVVYDKNNEFVLSDDTLKEAKESLIDLFEGDSYEDR